MSVVYVRSDSVGRQLVPAPLISISKNYQTNDDGTQRGTSYSITLAGTLLPFRGSPSGSYDSLGQAFDTVGADIPDETIVGSNEDFNHILRKQEALRWLFGEDGGSLEWQPAAGQPPVRCNPKVLSIDFADGQWADRCNYTIQLEAPWIYINGTIDLEDSVSTDLVSSSVETWSFEEIDGNANQQYRVSHEVSAKGKVGYDGGGSLYNNKQAWEHAKAFVDVRISGTVGSDVMLAALGAIDKVTGSYSNVIRIDKDGGVYGITEEWLLSDSGTYEERQFTVEYDNALEEYTVTYQGVLHGITEGSRAGDVDNINTARAAIPSISTARSTAIAYIGSLLGGKVLPSFPDRKTFSLNQQDGTVTFTYQWNTSDSATTFTTEDAQHSESLDSSLNTLTYNQSVEGKGLSISVRLANAKNALSSDGLALSNAKSLAGTFLDYQLTSVVKSYDKRGGVVRGSWTWTDRDKNNTEVTIQTQEAASILAIIPIPGRADGPIVQDMGTKSSEIITVTMRSSRHTAKPSLNTEIYGGDGIIIGDSSSWNPKTGVAERVTRFLRET